MAKQPPPYSVGDTVKNVYGEPCKVLEVINRRKHPSYLVTHVIPRDLDGMMYFFDEVTLLQKAA